MCDLIFTKNTRGWEYSALIVKGPDIAYLNVPGENRFSQPQTYFHPLVHPGHIVIVAE